MDMWATITGYLVWSVALLAAVAVLLLGAAVLAERAARAAREAWFWRFGGPWRHLRKFLADDDLTDAQKLERLNAYQLRAQSFDRRTEP